MTGRLYRVRQFWKALTAKPTRQGMAEAKQVLPGALYTLFTRLQPSEKAHAIEVFRRVRAESSDHELLVAALMHDIGKIVQPLQLWERVLIVLVQKFQPRTAPPAAGTARKKPTGWTRALVVAEKHPGWGAQLVHKAGASPTVVRLVRRHQDPLTYEPESREDKLLRILQSADNVS